MSIEVRLENITKTFKTKNEILYALKNINFKIPPGKTISILGPSGCGKTTLLKIIAGLERPDEGKIFFNNEDVTELSPYERKIGMVFQNYALYPHYKARGNLAFPFWIKKTPEKEIDEKIKETAKILGVGFEYLLDKKPKELSGGEQQRVAIGRCIIRNPSIMLFDEPLSNLDAKLRVITRAQLKRLLVMFNTTSVYVTHDQTEAISIGDLIGIMNNGEIIQIGTCDEIANNPQNAFVASFFGKTSMNLIEVKVINSQIIWRNKGIPLEKPIEDGEYLLGFHGRDVLINPDGDIKGKIYFIDGTPADPSKILHIQLEDNTSIKIEIKSGEIYRCGENISFSLPKRIYLFKKSTGERVV
ncbi:MAG: ABC transporter ATP-binding protein [Dictyoglomus sp.]